MHVSGFRGLIASAVVFGAVSSANAGLLFFSSEAAFDGAASTATTQTFAQANGTGCANPLTSASSCGGFAPGDIAAGLTIAATGAHAGNDLLAAAPGSLSTNGAVYANFFSETLNLLFAPGTGAVGLGLLSQPSSSDLTVSFYDAADLLIGSTVVTSVANGGVGTFLGAVGTAGELIARVNISSPRNQAEGVDLVKFGAAAAIPAPATLALLGLGLVGVASTRGMRFRRA